MMPEHSLQRARRRRFILAPFGSRGDVDPLIALGLELQARGNSVLLLAPANFERDAQLSGLEFSASAPDFSRHFDGSQSNESVLAGALADAPTQFASLEQHAGSADLIVGSALQFGAPTIARKWGVPYVYALFAPIFLRRAASAIATTSGSSWGGADLRDAGKLHWINGQRELIGLKPIESVHDYLVFSGDIIGAFDPILSPMGNLNAAGTSVSASGREMPFIAGHFRRQASASLPAAVVDFLRRGAPPIYVGFGSMRHNPDTNPTADVVAALLRRGERVITTGATDIASSHLLTINSVAHDALFPQTGGVIHHGGAGTTLAAARAGVPQLLIPHLGDQFYHGDRIMQLQLGPPAIPLADLTPAELSRPLDALLGNSDFRSNAANFAAPLRAREGTKAAAKYLESLLESNTMVTQM